MDSVHSQFYVARVGIDAAHTALALALRALIVAAILLVAVRHGDLYKIGVEVKE